VAAHVGPVRPRAGLRADDSVEADVTLLARRIAQLGSASGERAGVFDMGWWSERMLSWAMADPAFRTQLFRFVDVFPATRGDADALAHLHEYFTGPDSPRLLDLGVELAERVPGGAHISAAVVRRSIDRMAHQFIIGATPEQVAVNLEALWRVGSAYTVDLLGEKTLSSAEADAYASRLDALIVTLGEATQRWAPDDHLERDDIGPLPRVNVSIKATALAPLYAPLTCEEGKAQALSRLGPLLRLAARVGAFVWLDMEHYDVKDLTIEVFRELMDTPELAGLDAGIVLQAYLRDTWADACELIDWSADRLRRVEGAKPIGIRLVKGAYWDAEVAHARSEGWPVPVFEAKGQTDANYERLTRLLHAHHGEVRAAFGSHNLRSLAYAVTWARHLGIPDTGYECQMLHGMAEPVHAAIRRLGLRLRVYAPMGDLVPGMSYLIRRLLENTSQEGFVRARFVEGRSLDELVAPPPAGKLPGPQWSAAPRRTSDPEAPGRYTHAPGWEWRVRDNRLNFSKAVGEMGRRLAEGPLAVSGVIDGEAVRTAESFDSVDPGEPVTVVASAAACGPAEADAAVAVALRAFGTWSVTPVVERVRVIFGAASWLMARRLELAAMEVFEVGKPWAEADADVCEAVDFCEYYGREMLRLGSAPVESAPGEVLRASESLESPPGEANSLGYGPKGVCVVISPWNFPLAIPTGMVVAALVAGNSVVLKPAEQAPAVASMLVKALAESGLPKGVIGFLPGDGSLGAHLVRHRDVAIVAFTGSLAVGLEVNAAAAVHQPGQRQVKTVVAEMGGKNAIIVDSDADLDTVVPAVVASAFGYAGQKCSACSRLIVLDEVHDDLLRRLVGAVGELVVGHPRKMGVLVGPLIDAEAQARVRSYLSGSYEDVPGPGSFVRPTVIDGVAPSAPLAREEIFGPVLAVLRAASFEEALSVANDTDYALTAGVFSRSPSHIGLAVAGLRAGNVYVNRGITGAVPGRQPFGGYGLSGAGPKAGGPHYLSAFLEERVVCESTLRRGFLPG
jgi:RHH-type proline utilization regulon transcriptional repressor/proline dehydrogenase/delta 1-pyrroline-5-carboxylate dehydrogenase